MSAQKQRIVRLISAVFFCLFALSSEGRSIIIQAPKFGAPVVRSNQLIFTYPDARQPKIISIHRETGEKVWETSVTNQGVALWETSRNAMASVGDDLFELNTRTGGLEQRFRLGFPVETLVEISPDLLLVKRRSVDGLTNTLLAVRSTDWTMAWMRTNVYQFLDADRDRVLVEVAEPDLSQRNIVFEMGFWPQKNMAIALLESRDGRVLWKTPATITFSSNTAVLADSYVVLSGHGRIACVSARDGSLLHRIPASSPNDVAAIWREGAGVFTDFSSNLVATLDLPSLSNKVILRHEKASLRPHDYRAFSDDVYIMRSVFSATCAFDIQTGERRWPAGTLDRVIANAANDAHWAWSGVHNGTIYVSRANLTTKRTTIEAVDVHTGRSRELHSAPLPVSE